MGYALKQIFELILCFVMPPAAVLVSSGYHISCCSHTTLNILLTLLGWVPGTRYLAHCSTAPSESAIEHLKFDESLHALKRCTSRHRTHTGSRLFADPLT